VAVHVDLEVLIVGEALSVGDYLFQRRCKERMCSVTNDAATVLFGSHDLSAVTELCQRTMVLEHGKVFTIGSTDALVQRYLSDALKPSGGANKQIRISHFEVRDRRGEKSHSSPERLLGWTSK
jgi:ABC-type polysaccharide/polyol phosphate transport system ATPase subunit